MDRGPIPTPLTTEAAHAVYQAILNTTDLKHDKAILIAVRAEWMILSATLNHHTQDEHCYVDAGTELCAFCGVDHSEECGECQGRGFHAEGCVRVEIWDGEQCSRVKGAIAL